MDDAGGSPKGWSGKTAAVLARGLLWCRLAPALDAGSAASSHGLGPRRRTLCWRAYQYSASTSTSLGRRSSSPGSWLNSSTRRRTRRLVRGKLLVRACCILRLMWVVRHDRQGYVEALGSYRRFLSEFLIYIELLFDMWSLRLRLLRVVLLRWAARAVGVQWSPRRARATPRASRRWPWAGKLGSAGRRRMLRGTRQLLA